MPRRQRSESAAPDVYETQGTNFQEGGNHGEKGHISAYECHRACPASKTYMHKVRLQKNPQKVALEYSKVLIFYIVSMPDYAPQ